MFLFKGKSKTSLGVDIGASAIKLVELQKEDERYELMNYAIYSLAGHLRENKYQTGNKSFFLSTKEIAKALKTSMKQAGIETKKAYFSIPVAFSFSTVINFPEMPESELASAVSYEAQKYVPVPISEVVLDWSIIGHLKTERSEVKSSDSGPSEFNDSKNNEAKTNNKERINSLQVLLVAVPKKLIENYKEISELAGLKTEAMEEETFSLSRALVGNDKSTIVLVDLGARSMNVSIIDEGRIWLSHNLEVGGIKLTKEIANRLGMDISEAEKIKKQLSQKMDDIKIKGIVHDVMGPAMFEIKRIIESYQKKYSKKVDKCILAGGGSRIADFENYLSNKVGLDVSLGSPFARMVYPQELKPILGQMGFSLAVAVGSAMH